MLSNGCKNFSFLQALPFILDSAEHSTRLWSAPSSTSSITLGASTSQSGLTTLRLQWLMTFREPEGQLARWIEELHVYDFTMVHKPGARHGNADVLSRHPCYTDGCHYCEKKETQDGERLQPDVKCTAVDSEGLSTSRGPTTVDVAEWGRKQGEDVDIRPVLMWVVAQC